MRPISVLFTNNSLGLRGGSESYLRDVALALLRRGHRPVAFSLVHGETAADLRQATIPVVDDLTRLGDVPDVIHGHHHFETLIAALAFPGVPVVNFCHGWIPWEEMPLHHPAVRRYVAVDEVCVDRLVREEGISPDLVELLLNFVDLDRFRPRPPLPARPARALVLSNYATSAGYTRVIAAACHAAGVTLDVVGAANGNPTDCPAQLLASYDLVFAKGRTALEALAAGCATVLADRPGAGPLVTPDNYEVLRRRNFGIRELTHGHDVAWYGRAALEVLRPRSGGRLGARARGGQHRAGDRSSLGDLHRGNRCAACLGRRLARGSAALLPDRQAAQAVVRARGAAGDAPRRSGTGARRARCARTAAQQATATHALQTRLQALEVRLAESRLVEEQLRARERELVSAGERIRTLERELTTARQELHRPRQRAGRVPGLSSLRLRDAVLRAPMVGSVLHAGARRVAKLLRH